MKILFVMTLVGFFNIVADIHMDDFAASEEDKSDSCCVTCCPAHNMGPSVQVSVVSPVHKVDCEIPAEISVHTEEFIASVFHPPRLTA